MNAQNDTVTVTLVSGLPRSGTSMMMSMLQAGGMELVVDGERTADEDNPKGYFELERIKKINIKIGGCPITTPHKKYNGQVKLDSGEWLTVPVTVKDKYKILRAISSLTHESFEVRIIE